MSVLLLNFTKAYLNERINTNCFVDAYIELWRIEREIWGWQILMMRD